MGRLDELWAAHGATSGASKEDEALASLREGGFAAAEKPSSRLNELWQAHGNAEAPETSKAESAVRGGVQGATSGFGDEVSAAIDTGVSKIPFLRDVAQGLHDKRFPALTNPDATYAQRRDAYRAANQQAEESNPLTYGAGNLAGTAAQTLALPGAGAGSTVGRLAARGAAEGAAAGLGYSNAQDVSGMAKDALVGGAVGGVVSGALGAVTNKAARGADQRVKRDLVDAITENEGTKATAKTAKNVRSQAEKIAEVIDSEPNQPIAAALKDPPKAIKLIDDRMGALNSQVRAPAYEALNEVSGGVKAGELTKPFEDELAKLTSGGPQGRGATGAGPMKKFLQGQIKDMRGSWSREVTPEEQLQTIVDKVVPKESPLRATLSGRTIEEQQGLVSEMFGKDLTPHDAAVLRSELKPLRVWDPSVRLTEDEARAHLTQMQTAAKETFGTLAQTPNAQRYEQAVDLAQGAHNAHLDAVAASHPDAAKIVDTVRAYNKESSALLSVRDAMKTIAEKQESTNTKGLVHQLHDKGSMAGLAYGAAMGHPVAAVAGYGALKLGIPAAKALGTKTNLVLKSMMQQARAGSGAAALKVYAIEQGIPEASAQFLADRAVHLMDEGQAQ